VYAQPLTLLKGVGEKKAEKLKKIGLGNFDDVLYDFPRRYIDRRVVKHVTDIATDEMGVISARVIKKRTKYIQKTKKEMLILDVSEGYFTGEIIFFSAKFFVADFVEGETYFFFGKVEKSGPLFKMIQPDYARIADKSFLGIIPVYNATLGISQHDLVSVHKQVLSYLINQIEDTLPESLRAMAGLIPLEEAMHQIHFPTSKEGYVAAKKRIVYDELFFLQLRLILLKRNYHKPLLKPFVVDSKMDDIRKRIPFELTDAQTSVLRDIFEDMQSGYSMNRLIQGDVGSGKTIVAFLTLLLAVFNGKQGILLAPTTLLAEQHYENFVKLFPEFSCCLLTSSVPTAEKKRIKASILDGTIKVIIGTHAVIQDDVKFSSLGVVITDEQHRFGIRQRLSALQKAEKPHALIMSATPIPRTLSLILYGDMDISVINQMPQGRKPIKTHFVKPDKVSEMYAFIQQKLEEGRQGYVICPLIEESETMDLNAAETIYKTLISRFAPFKVGLIHGKMKAIDKDAVMHAFKSGDIALLVSTTVIEVGIHVANATTMVIMNTERFGLSQLHQLRGRVGRGDEQSYCFLLSEKLSATAKQRVETLVGSNDGFEVAEKDLELRGPGEIFGLRQHGIPELKMANLIKNKDVIAEVQKHIRMILEEYNMNHKAYVELINKQNINLEKWFTL
jgi:ATP-dependent DNA helicase RecG